MNLTIAHSPDADDAFMFYAMACGRIDTGSFQFKHVLKDIETLNQEAKKGTYEISAVSLHTFPFISDRYNLLSCGASVGDNYGPMVVSREGLSLEQFLETYAGKKSPRSIAVPGLGTTAFLVLRLMLGEANYKVYPFDQIIAAVENGEVDAGLIIHEGQLTFQENGLKKIVDLGVWWRKEHKLPLPLGANVIRKDIPEADAKQVANMIRRSIEFSLADENIKDAVAYSKQYSRGLDDTQAERFIRMYVNQRTLDFDAECIEAVNLLYDQAARANLIPKQSPIVVA